MTLGLKRGAVELTDHDPEWEAAAASAIARLWDILGPAASDIQHVGSTAIRHIKAKPVIDIAVSVHSFEKVLALTPALEAGGFIFRGWEGDKDRQPVFQCGEYVPGENDMRLLTHYVHIVKAGRQQWHNYINFRDYMNACPAAALEYEAVKVRLAEENRDEGDLSRYHQGKRTCIAEWIRAANQWNDNGRNRKQH